MKRNIKVAVVDSGVDEQYYRSRDFIVDIFGYVWDVKKIEKSKEKQDIFDIFGHGTMSIDCIHRLQPGVNIVSIKILDDNGETNVKVLEKALEDLIEYDVDIVNLSLSLTNQNYYKLDSICSKLREQGKIIIASTYNNQYSSYPAAFSDVIGVIGRGFSSSREYEVSDDRIELVCDRAPMIVNDGYKHWCMYIGNSKATCIATSLVCEVLNSNRVSRDKESILRELECRQIKMECIDPIAITMPQKREDILKFGEVVYKAEKYCCETLECKIEDLYKKRLFEFDKVNSHFVVELLKIWLEDRFYEDTLVISYKNIEWFYSALFVEENDEI